MAETVLYRNALPTDSSVCRSCRMVRRCLSESRTGNHFRSICEYSLWDVGSDSPVLTCRSFLYARTAGDLIFGVFADGSMGTYDTTTGERNSFAYSLQPLPTALAVSPDGSFMVIGYAGGRLVVVDVATGQTSLSLQIDDPATTLTFFRSVDQIVLSDHGDRIYVAASSVTMFDARFG